VKDELDGTRTLRTVAAELAAAYAAPVAAIEADVTGLVGQLVRQGALRLKGCDALARKQAVNGEL